MGSIGALKRDRFDQEQFESWQRYKNAKRKLKKPVRNPVVAYGGTSGSYSEDASIAFFGEDSIRVACRQFEDVFKSIAGGQADYGVLPIENSTTGSVKDIYEMLLKYDCYIVGETQVRVDHCLMGVPGATLEDITDIYSHEQSLMQCSLFLEAHPQWQQHSYVNNALAAEYVSNTGQKNLAAIASRRAASVHNLEVLEEHINFLDINTTRFIIIANHPEETEDSNKISVSFAVKHKPGALVRVLNIFDQHQLNLCKIESRPNHIRNWEYNFFVDIEGRLNDVGLDETIHEVIAETAQFRFLGSYAANIN